MNIKKISTLIISASIVAGTIALNGNNVYAQTINKVETTVSNKEVTINKNDSKQTTVKAIAINNNITANITVNKSWSSSGSSTNTAGGSVNYEINISFNGLNSVKNIKDFKITLTPKLCYTNYDKMTPTEKIQADKAIEQLNKSISYKVTPIEDGIGTTIESTTAIKAIASVTVDSCDYCMYLKPNIVISYKEPNGEKASYTVSNTGLEEDFSQKYNDSVTAFINTGKNLSYGISSNISIKGNSSNNPLGVGYYNPSNHKINSITFKLTNSDPNATLAPIKSLMGNNFISDGNNEYTISGDYITKYMENLQDLFTLTRTSDSGSVAELVLTPESITYNNYSSTILKETTSLLYEPAQGSVVFGSIDKNSSPINANQDVSTSGKYYAPSISYESDVKEDGETFNVYTGVALENGQAIIVENGTDELKSNQVGVSLTNSELQVMLYGTPQEKYEMFTGIINGTVGTSYTQNKLNTGTKIDDPINFIYSEGTGGVSSGNIDIFGTEKEQVIEKACTIAYSSTPLASFTGLNSYDEVIKDTNGAIIGFLMGSNPEYNETYIDNKETGYDYYGGQSTSIRFGDDEQHNTSSLITDMYLSMNSCIDNLNKNLPDASFEWLTEPHEITIHSGGYQCGYISVKKGTDVIINCSVPMQISSTSSCIINGTTYKLTNYTLSNDNKTLTFTLPETIPWGSTISVNGVYFLTFANTSIDVKSSFQGTGANPSGMILNVNDQNINYSCYYKDDIHDNKSSDNSIVIPDGINCIQYATTLNSNNETQLTDIIHNQGQTTCTCRVVGTIPTTESETLTGSEGNPSYGGITSELTNINPNGAIIWLLPRSDYTEYESSLSDINALNIGKQFGVSGSPGLGWVKYTPGMNLSNYIAYVAQVNIASGANWYMSYGIKLTGLTGKEQYATSEFKYYGNTNQIGGVSNIITVAVNGVTVTPSWVSSIGINVNGEIQNLNSSQLETQVDGQTLSYLNSSGLDNDGKNDSIPDTSSDHLLQEFKMLLDTSALNEAGFKFDGVYINGVYYNGSTQSGITEINKWLSNTNMLKESDVDSFKFVLSTIPQGIIKVEVNEGNGNILNKEYSGFEGNSQSITEPTIPYGYKISSITVNGNKVSSVNNIAYTDGTQTIVYNLQKSTGQIITQIDLPNGTIAPNGEKIYMGNVGIEFSEQPSIPTGYKIGSITVNGEIVTSISGIEYESSTQEIIYHLVEESTKSGSTTQSGGSTTQSTGSAQGSANTIQSTGSIKSSGSITQSSGSTTQNTGSIQGSGSTTKSSGSTTQSTGSAQGSANTIQSTGSIKSSGSITQSSGSTTQNTGSTQGSGSTTKSSGILDTNKNSMKSSAIDNNNAENQSYKLPDTGLNKVQYNIIQVVNIVKYIISIVIVLSLIIIMWKKIKK